MFLVKAASCVPPPSFHPQVGHCATWQPCPGRSLCVRIELVSTHNHLEKKTQKTSHIMLCEVYPWNNLNVRLCQPCVTRVWFVQQRAIRIFLQNNRFHNSLIVEDKTDKAKIAASLFQHHQSTSAVSGQCEPVHVCRHFLVIFLQDFTLTQCQCLVLNPQSQSLAQEFVFFFLFCRKARRACKSFCI